MPHHKVFQNLGLFKFFTLFIFDYQLIILCSFDGNDEFCKLFIKTER